MYSIDIAARGDAGQDICGDMENYPHLLPLSWKGLWDEIQGLANNVNQALRENNGQEDLISSGCHELITRNFPPSGCLGFPSSAWDHRDGIQRKVRVLQCG